MDADTKKELEIEARKLFAEDAGKHREYIETQFTQLKWAVGILLLVAGGFITFMGSSNYADLVKNAEKQINTRILQVDDRVMDAQFIDSLRKRVQERIPTLLTLDENKTNITRFIEAQMRAQVTTDAGRVLNTKVQEILEQFKQTDFAKATMPRGVIVPWIPRGPVPDGWAICDGQAGTPDLRDRFLMGTGDTNSVGVAGGSREHTHQVYKERAYRDGNGFQGEGDAAMLGRTSPSSHLPPYVTVIYLMKL